MRDVFVVVEVVRDEDYSGGVMFDPKVLHVFGDFVDFVGREGEQPDLVDGVWLLLLREVGA